MLFLKRRFKNFNKTDVGPLPVRGNTNPYFILWDIQPQRTV